MNSNNDAWIIYLFFFVAAVLALRRRWRPSGTAFGSAAWASDKILKAAGMLSGKGLVIGRTLGGALIQLPRFNAALLIGGAGSGKGVGVIIPNVLSYFRGSRVCFDPKGDLYETTAKQLRAARQRILRLAPWNGGMDAFNPLSTILPDSPMLVDHARATAEALVERQGTESDMHWNDKAVQVITAIIVFVLLKLNDEDRNLNSVQEIASDPDMLRAVADQLRTMGDIPARLGSQLKPLFERDGTLTKEGAGVISTMSRHLAWLDSDLVAKAVSHSTFDPLELDTPGRTLFIQIPPGQLEAARGLLRCWIATLVRVLSANGDERKSEVLFLLDEASALGSLPALEEVLVRGRSAGVRLLLAYQSESQVRAAFKNKPSLLFDNCSAQIYLGATSYETAERISKSCGDWTQCVESYSENESCSWQSGGQGGSGSNGTSVSYSVSGRALVRPEEILAESDDILYAFVRGMSPIRAQKVKWYQDRDFNPRAPRHRKKWTFWRWFWIFVGVAMTVVGLTAK